MGSNIIHGTSGDDILSGGVGSNIINGYAGNDTVDYSQLSGTTQYIGSPLVHTGVDLDLSAGTAIIKFVNGHFAWNDVDQLNSIENAIRTQFES